MKSEPSAAALVLAMIRVRTRDLLNSETYDIAMNNAVNLDVLVNELINAERTAGERG